LPRAEGYKEVGEAQIENWEGCPEQRSFGDAKKISTERKDRFLQGANFNLDGRLEGFAREFVIRWKTTARSGRGV
jgi:hypothetical protein